MYTLSNEEYEIILGGLLGDSYYNKKNRTIRFAHSNKQREYLEWKYSFFADGYKSQMHDYIRSQYNNEYYGSYFELKLAKFNSEDVEPFLRKNLYSNDGRKKISLKYLKQLTPLSLAVWWMDDGCLSVHKGNRYGKLCTHCFNYEENILIKKYLKDKWDIDVDIRIEKQKYYFIRLNVEALKRLIRIIYPYVIQIPSMIYKIDLNYKNQKSIGGFQDVYNIIKNAIDRNFNDCDGLCGNTHT